MLWLAFYLLDPSPCSLLVVYLETDGIRSDVIYELDCESICVLGIVVVNFLDGRYWKRTFSSSRAMRNILDPQSTVRTGLTLPSSVESGKLVIISCPSSNQSRRLRCRPGRWIVTVPALIIRVSWSEGVADSKVAWNVNRWVVKWVTPYNRCQKSSIEWNLYDLTKMLISYEAMLVSKYNGICVIPIH